MGTTSRLPSIIRELQANAAAPGKVSVETRAPKPADGSGKPENALWNQIDPVTGVQVAVWRWTGAAWVNMPLSLTGEYSTGDVSNPDGLGNARAVLGSTRVRSQMDGSYYSAPALFFDFDAPWIDTAPFLSTSYGTDVFMQSASFGNNPSDQSSVGVDSGYAHMNAALWGEGGSQGGSNVVTSAGRDGAGVPRWGEARMRTNIVKKNANGTSTSHAGGAWVQVDALAPTNPTATFAAFGLGEPTGVGAGNNKLWISGDGDAKLTATRNIDLTASAVRVNGQPVATDSGVWVNCPLLADGVMQGSRLPQVRLVGKHVYMKWGVNRGAMQANASYAVATLPAGFRPTEFKYIPIAGSTAASSAMLVVQDSGVLEIRTGATVGNYYIFDSAHWFID